MRDIDVPEVKQDVWLMLGDCLERMEEIPEASVDMILADPPYGTTQNKWDSVIGLDLMWRQYERILKPAGVVVIFAQTPFDKVLGCSNLGMLKYEWIWEKTAATGHLNAKKCPMKAHENILVFYDKPPTYNPQMLIGQKPTNSFTKRHGDGECYGKTAVISGGGSTTRYPRSVQIFKSDKQQISLHPTQKPIALMEYLIKTYTNDGETVLDNCMGSGTTGVACINTGRNFIGIEMDDKYFETANTRIENAVKAKHSEKAS